MHGNDTIDRYPPTCGELSKILCISEKVFKKILKDWMGFVKENKPICSSKSKTTQKPKIKLIKVKMPKNHFELINDPESIYNTFNHRKGRINDWYHTYGQGMYED